MGKVAELTPLLPQVPTKELHGIFQTVVDKVFGLQSGGRGWDIAATLRTSHPREYTSLASFLATDGPLLAAAYRLLAEPYLRYDFPISRLPASTQLEVESGTCMNPLLQTRLSPGRATLSLNSFEFYLFTWAAYIVQPYSPDNRLVAGESLYPFVLEDYLGYFLPCDGTTPPRLPFQLAALPPSPQEAQPPSPPASSTPARKSLLRHPSILSPTSISSPSNTTTTAPCTPRQHQHHPPAQDQTWRSETLLNIFSLVWLSQFDSSSQGSAPIPVQDTLKIIRMLIKHLHYFANSGGPADTTPLERLKRTVLPMTRSRLYTLFRHIFSHWPHDSSFRLVLETWLSFIQPWRYTDRGRPQAHADTDLQVDSRWQGFVAENLLLYSSVLRLLLPRLLRMDLTSTKNAYLLFRTAKVFSQSGLTHLLQAAEGALGRREASSPLMPSLVASPPPLEETLVAAARQAVMELEGPGFNYSPLFDTEFRQSIVDLLSSAERAREAAAAGLVEVQKSDEKEEGGASWIQWLVGEQGQSSSNSAEAEELRRCIQHLSCSTAALAEVFSVSMPGGESSERQSGGLSGGSGGRAPERLETEAGRVLTPHGRWQLVQGIAKGEVRYEGDPDLAPITHSEVVFLVRMLHQASLWISERWGPQLRRNWYSKGLLGEATRQVLAPPCTFVVVKKRVCGGPPSRTLSSHPPRLALRPLASKKVLVYLAVYLIFLRLLGYSLPSSLLLLLVFFFLAILLISAVRVLKGGERGFSLLDTSDIQDIDSGIKKTQ